MHQVANLISVEELRKSKRVALERRTKKTFCLDSFRASKTGVNSYCGNGVEVLSCDHTDELKHQIAESNKPGVVCTVSEQGRESSCIDPKCSTKVSSILLSLSIQHLQAERNDQEILVESSDVPKCQSTRATKTEFFPVLQPVFQLQKTVYHQREGASTVPRIRRVFAGDPAIFRFASQIRGGAVDNVQNDLSASLSLTLAALASNEDTFVVEREMKAQEIFEGKTRESFYDVRDDDVVHSEQKLAKEARPMRSIFLEELRSEHCQQVGDELVVDVFSEPFFQLTKDDSPLLCSPQEVLSAAVGLLQKRFHTLVAALEYRLENTIARLALNSQASTLEEINSMSVPEGLPIRNLVLIGFTVTRDFVTSILSPFEYFSQKYSELRSKLSTCADASLLTDPDFSLNLSFRGCKFCNCDCLNELCYPQFGFRYPFFVLESLGFYNCFGVPMSCFHHILSLHSRTLKTIVIHGTYAGRLAIDVIKSILVQDESRLKILALEYCGLSEKDDCIALWEAVGKSRLEMLYACGTPLTQGVGGAFVAAVEKCKSLKSVQTHFCSGTTNRFIEAIDQLIYHRKHV